MRRSGVWFLPLLFILLIGAGIYVRGAQHPSAASSAGSSAQDARTVDASFTLFIDQVQLNTAHQPKTLKTVRCVRASTWPSLFEHNPGQPYDCRAIFTTTAERYCILFNPDFNQVVTDFQGQRMCEGPPDPTQDP